MGLSRSRRRSVQPIRGGPALRRHLPTHVGDGSLDDPTQLLIARAGTQPDQFMLGYELGRKVPALSRVLIHQLLQKFDAVPFKVVC
jgi:hypothetical protein